MTPEQRAKAKRDSKIGAGPRIVTQATVERLQRSGAPKHLVESAQRAMRTNPA
jgi:hypothetical protein